MACTQLLPLITLFMLLSFFGVHSQRQHFNHQTTTYTSHIKPFASAEVDITATPIFSPDHALSVLTKLIEGAQTSVDIGTPGFSSWSGCTNFENGGVGCGIEYCRTKELFPIFQALLNAVNRGVKVRILTNSFDVPTTPGLIDPLDFLTIAGAETRYYTSTTFYHCKYINIDGRQISISSINFTYTSFMENREAGLVLSGAGAEPLISNVMDAFNDDWAQALPWPVNTYNASDMAIITNKSPIPVVIPEPRSFNGAWITELKTYHTTADALEVIYSPDFAWNAISQALNASQKVKVYIYQITDGGFCPLLLDLYRSGVYVEIFVSDKIFSETDYEKAQKCYTDLHDAGIKIRKTAKDMYKYSHQKYWFVTDKSGNEALFLSTGNWGQSDYPEAPNVFPPKPSPAWRDVNRDYTLHIKDTDIIAQFYKVFDEDYKRGYTWTPSSWVAGDKA